MEKPDELRHRELKAKEFVRNRALLNKCQKRYKLIFIAYGFSLIAFPLFSLFLMLGSVFSNDSIFLFFDSFIIYPLAIVFAWKGAYRKQDLYVLLTVGTVALNQLILFIYKNYFATGEYLIYFKFYSVTYSTPIHLFLLAVIVIIATLNMKTNVVFHELEQADGYPHFNERFFEQDMTKRQLAIKDPYQIELERITRNSSDSMPDVELPDGSQYADIRDNV